MAATDQVPNPNNALATREPSTHGPRTMDAKTAADMIFVGKDRAYNRRIQQMRGHYLVEPVACTPASR